MKRLLPVVFALAAVVSFFPRLGAQNQTRIFTTGTPAELAQARALGLQRLRALALEKGIDGPDDLAITSAHVDRLSMAHTRVQQRFGGIPVLGGEAIAHFNADGTSFADTDNLVANINVSTTPLLTQAAAIDAAVADYGCRTCLTAAPTADLWIVRDDAGVDHLTYRVQMRRKDGTAQMALPVRFIDAQGGQVVLSYDNLQTGTGSSLYSGTVYIGTQPTVFNDYVMENHARGIGTFDMMNTCCWYYYYIDLDDVWDDAPQRAGVDAHYGMEKYFTYLSAVHGRNGIDGSGGPFSYPSDDGTITLVSSFVHLGESYNNAFWDPGDNSMNYGDGDGSLFSPLVSLDIAGHEMTHGVTQFTAGLIYHDESGALNESWSDVFGAMLERYVRGESANTWLLAEEAYTPSIGGDALRYMNNPHLAVNRGWTADDDPDHYSERCTAATTCPDTPQGDNGGVHTNSGIPNYAFYLLAKGGTHHLGGSMTGIGADAAAQIWFTALTSYMTSSTDFAGARLATSQAAAALYGSSSTRQKAVETAWCLVGVGACPTVVTVEAVSVSPSSGTGVTQTFTLNYTDSAGVAADLNGAYVRFTNVANPGLMCMIQHQATTGQVRIKDDFGVWGPFTSYGIGTIANSQCSLDLVNSLATPSGNDLTLSFTIAFLPTFAGPVTISMRAQSLSGADTGMLPKGSWTVGGATVDVVSIAPNSGTGVIRTFNAAFTDSQGVSADLKRAMVRFGATTLNACVVDYNAITATVRLFDDTGVPGTPASFGTMSTLSNSQCTLDLSQSSAAPSGTNLSLTLRLIFKPPLLGPQPISMKALSNFGANTGWLSKGTWTIGATVNAISVTPNTGSGLTQSFAFAFSDSEGVVADLKAARMRFRGATGGACVIEYNAMTNQVRMQNDLGEWGAFKNFGSGAINNNSQCSLNLVTSSAAPSGANLTLTLVVTFKQPAFSGDKNIDMRANSNVGSTTGWVNRGAWTVP